MNLKQSIKREVHKTSLTFNERFFLKKSKSIVSSLTGIPTNLKVPLNHQLSKIQELLGFCV